MQPVSIPPFFSLVSIDRRLQWPQVSVIITHVKSVALVIAALAAFISIVRDAT